MTPADLTFALFTCCNSVRVLAYMPQVFKAATDQDGAKEISLATWGLFLVCHLSAAAYAFVNRRDLPLALVFLGNAAGCGGILLATAIRRTRHRRQEPSARRADNVISLPRRDSVARAA